MNHARCLLLLIIAIPCIGIGFVLGTHEAQNEIDALENEAAEALSMLTSSQEQIVDLNEQLRQAVWDGSVASVQLHELQRQLNPP